uniref:SCP domain-containing protein n=1 Tax=Chenopodium quinoa TaxID=63459 RepID=A0A803MCQ6_CHEQI
MVHLVTTLLILLFISSAYAQAPPPQPPLAGPAQEYLDAHNQARAQVGVGPLKWSPNLENATARLAMYQRIKFNCQFADLNKSKIKYGANQLWAQGSSVGPKTAVDAWVAEKKYYNHEKNSCEENRQCGVYTQVVWRKSVELGCSQTSCVKNGTSLIVCFYNPPGNVIGESPY